MNAHFLQESDELYREFRNKLAAYLSSKSPGKKRLEELRETAQGLIQVVARVDSTLQPERIFDPSDPKTAGHIIALTLVAQPMYPLGAIRNFYGSGVYALYYKGDFEAYSALANTEHPIYVGKADPDAPTAATPVSQGPKLFNRLSEHAKNIRKATSTLRIEDFHCRFLVVQSGFQNSAEGELIHFFKPIWNTQDGICHGLGKHGDNSETRQNKRSPWDTMHPGRDWAVNTREDQKSVEQIHEDIREHFAKYPPYQSLDDIFQRFIAEMGQWSQAPVAGVE